jgi:NAD(P)H-nitrite reductase large subunit
MIVCHCHRVTSAAVETAIAGGAATVNEVTQRSRAGGGCGSCRPTLEAILALEARLAHQPDRPRVEAAA